MSWKRSLSLKPDEDNEEIGEQRLDSVGLQDVRSHRWNSFMSNLEEVCDDDDDDDDEDDWGEVEEHSPVPTQAVQQQQQHTAQAEEPTSGGRGGVDVVDPQDGAVPVNHVDKPSSHSTNFASLNSLYMRQLMGSASAGNSYGTGNEANHLAVEPRAGLPSSLPLRDWINYYANNDNQLSTSHRHIGKRMDKKYLEKATRIALSLAKALQEGHKPGTSDIIQIQDIIVDSVFVTNTETGEVEFFLDCNSCSESESGSTLPSEQTQRIHIGKLGVIFYQLFTQGSLPSVTEYEPIHDQSSFDVALNIISDGEDACLPDDATHRQKQTRRASGEGSRTYYAALQLAGLPPSLCRLVADMLENNVNGSEGLFRPDKSVSFIADVVSDLEQMADRPDLFLHDSLLRRLEPIMLDKLYGRNDELHQCLEMANGVTLRESEGMGSLQSAIMITGFSGCGKSSLVEETSVSLEKKGWRRLQCKFDQEARPQPLSTVTSAFDLFLTDIVGRFDNNERQEVQTSLVSIFDDGEICSLCQLIPTLRELLPVKDTSPKQIEISFNTRDAAASKCRLHRMFGLLLDALSTQTKPLLLVMDDLQWADASSLELINSLVEGVICENINEESMSTSGGSNMLFVGCYRSNEVADSDPLAKYIQHMKDCSTIKLKEIHLGGLSCDDVNDMVSDSLFYPRRLTQSLANLIQQKTAGSPLFVKEFLNSLSTENLLTYSLSQHKWQFDEDLIQLKTVSDGVADLLARRLQRLPDNVLSGLQIMSCFGHDVSVEMLVHVRDVCGNTDIITGLDTAIEELLIKKTANGSYSFVHDLIQQTVYHGIPEQKRIQMLKEIADTMINRTNDGRKDAELFVIVNLMNRVSPHITPDSEDRALYAQFNLWAGQKSMKTTDFAAACSYLESGISFLDGDDWALNYSLSLELFKTAALVHWTLGKTNLMTERINEVLSSAKCYGDKLDSIHVLIRSYGMGGISIEKALEHCLAVLEYLGEPVATDLDNDDHIRRELVDTYSNLQKLLPASLDNLPIMEDPQKKVAMKFLQVAVLLCYQQKSHYFPLVACRMVRLTMSHGRCSFSTMGLACMANIFVRQSVASGYKLGKAAMSLNNSPECFNPEVPFYVAGLVNVWKEPWGALLPTLVDCRKRAIKFGEINNACLLSVVISYALFYLGSPLQSLEKGQVSASLRLMSRHKMKSYYLHTMPISNAISDFTGGPQHKFWQGVQGFADDNSNLSHAFETKEFACAERIFIVQSMRHLIFRRMDLAEHLVRQYHEFFNLQPCAQPISNIARTFYTGLIALHCLRQADDPQYWKGIALHARRSLETWAEECKWSFENKAFLLNAEYDFSIGEFDKAAAGYHASITSAQNHRLVHEEAIANELASHFHAHQGNKDLSKKLLKQAVDCYLSWGAQKKANALRQALQS